MEKELKIEIPQGYEIDRQKSTFEKIIFKKIPENPKTWKEYCALTKGSPSFYASCNAVDINCYSGEYNESQPENELSNLSHSENYSSCVTIG